MTTVQSDESSEQHNLTEVTLGESTGAEGRPETARPASGEPNDSATPCAGAGGTNETASGGGRAASSANAAGAATAVITVFASLRKTKGKRKMLPWSSLFEMLKQPQVTEKKESVPGFAPCLFKDDTRNKANVVECFALVLDVDNKTTATTVEEAAAVLPYYGLICSSHNNRRAKAEKGYVGTPPRFRIIVPYRRPVTPQEHARLWSWAERTFASKSIVVDRSAKDAGRFWFLPSCPPGMEDQYEHQLLDGALLDPDAILEGLGDAPPDEDDGEAEDHGEPLVDRIERAKKYLAKMPPAVQGENGSTACFNAACVLVRGFDLPPETAFEILRNDYNARCSPAWSDDELAHKVASAMVSTRPRGYLLRGQYGRTLKIGDHVELALRYIATLGDHVVFTQGSTYVYDDGIWSPLDEDTQLASVMKFSGAPVEGREGLSPLYLTRNACEGVVRLSQAQVANRTFFDVARRGLAFQNGLLAVTESAPTPGAVAKTIELLPHSPDNRARFAYPFAYDAGAACPKWQEFLDGVWAGDPDMFIKQSVLRQWLGASLFGLAPRFKKVILLWGDTNSGKSTLIKVVRALFPTGTVRTVPFHEWQEDYKRAKLADALLNTAAEVPSADLMKSEAFKAIVAGDSVGARNPFKEAFDFIPIAGHLFAANTLPRVHDRSDAVFDRVVILSFNRRFFRDPAPGQEKAIDGLDEDIIATEKAGIIAWAVRGLEQLFQSGGRYVIPPSSDEIVDSWKRDSDQLLAFFDEEFMVERGKRIRTEVAWGRYVAWADRSKHKVMSKTNFRREFEGIVAKKTGSEQPSGKSNGLKVFRDVRFIAGHDDQTFTGDDIEEGDDVGLRKVDNSHLLN